MRGSSLRNESVIAGFNSAGSRMELCGLVLMILKKRKCGDVGSERAAGAHEEVLDDRAERERGEKGERADDEDHGEEEDGEGRAVGRKSARARRRDFFRGEAASPRYSGVRPTIRPARKTVRMTNISIP